jgi:hypothetical protein
VRDVTVDVQQDLEARFGGEWEFWHGYGEWYATRRCGQRCPEPELHGSRHILRAQSPQSLAERLAARRSEG